jgi:hypothetical protein
VQNAFDARPTETKRRRHPNELGAQLDTPANELEQHGTTWKSAWERAVEPNTSALTKAIMLSRGRGLRKKRRASSPRCNTSAVGRQRVFMGARAVGKSADGVLHRSMVMQVTATQPAGEHKARARVPRNEPLQHHLRKLTKTKSGRELFRQRVPVEHSLAYIGYRQGHVLGIAASERTSSTYVALRLLQVCTHRQSPSGRALLAPCKLPILHACAWQHACNGHVATWTRATFPRVGEP